MTHDQSTATVPQGIEDAPRQIGSHMLSRRWAWVLVPMLVILALEAVRDTGWGAGLSPPLHLLILAVLLLGGAILVAVKLFRRFDRLTMELRVQNDELRARSAATSALQQVSLAVSSLDDLDRVLDTVTEQARQLVGGDASILCLAGDDGTLAPSSRSGPSKAFHPGPDACPHPDSRRGFCPLLSEVGSDQDRDAARLCRYIDPAYLGSSVAVPLVAGERVVGSLAVSSATSRPFEALELSTLGSLAAQAAVAIENTRLYDRVRELGIIEERARIARELHDGLSQVLGYVGTKSEAAISLLDVGRAAEARTQLHDLGDVARSVYIDVREAILGLSAPVPIDGGVVAAVRSYAERYEELAKLPTTVTADPGIDEIRLAPAAEAQALRLLQEALTNVRKHPDARRVAITASEDDATFVLEVADDGQGFDVTAPGRSDWPHYGLATMRERAASVGGTVEIESQRGRGTRIRFRLPLAAHGR
ncbi:MAG: GAF domain-containing sensor histidine kinase [Chloroflexota bacterium]